RRAERGADAGVGIARTPFVPAAVAADEQIRAVAAAARARERGGERAVRRLERGAFGAAACAGRGVDRAGVAGGRIGRARAGVRVRGAHVIERPGAVGVARVGRRARRILARAAVRQGAATVGDPFARALLDRRFAAGRRAQDREGDG